MTLLYVLIVEGGRRLGQIEMISVWTLLMSSQRMQMEKQRHGVEFRMTEVSHGEELLPSWTSSIIVLLSWGILMHIMSS